MYYLRTIQSNETHNFFSLGDDDDNKSEALKVFDIVIGWIYLVAWSSSFYG